MGLKIKAAIYRYTSIMLAHKEQLRYVQSREFFKEFERIQSHPRNTMSPRDIQGLLLGSWQAHHGFTRRMVNWGFTRLSPWYIRLAASIASSFLTLKSDLQRLFK